VLGNGTDDILGESERCESHKIPMKNIGLVL
jgi:hypothetical protein